MTLFQIALDSVRRRKAKTLFVLLGLAIGIATIVSIYSVLETMKADMTGQMNDYGANVLITADTGELTFSYGGISIPGVRYELEQLTESDVQTLEQLPARPLVRAIVPKVMGVVSSNAGDVVIVGSNVKDEFRLKPWLRLSRAGIPRETSEDDSAPGFWDAPEKRASGLLVTPGAAGQGGTNAGSKAPSGSKAATGSQDAAGAGMNPAAAGGANADDGSGMGSEQLDLEREDPARLNLRTREVILGARAADVLGLQTNDTIEIKDRTYVVRGLLQENGSPEDNQVMMSLGDAQTLLDMPGGVTTIDLAVDYATITEATFLQQVQTLLPGAKVTGLRQVILERDSVLTRLTRFGTAVALLVLLIGMLASALSMSAAVKERTREIGIFRAIGFRQAHIRQIIMLEGIMLSVIGGLIGYAAGILVARATAPALIGRALNVPWNLPALGAALLLAVIIGSLASAYPARQAARLDPATALIAL